MMMFRCAVLIVFCAVARPGLAAAADIVLDGEAACVAIGGAWAAAACKVERLKVPAGTRLFTIRGVAFVCG
jgi:hypothetical protein